MELGPRRVLVTMSAFVAAAGVAVAAAGTNAATVFSTRNSALGKILVSAGGRTLYRSSSEKRDRIECIGSCAVTWPPLVISARAKPIAGPGITGSLLGTVKRPDGRLQVTYGGLPLYLYSGDTKAGEVNGQGVGGIWHAITPSGTAVTKAAASSTRPSTGNTSNPNPSSGSGSTTGSGSSMGSGSSAGANPGMWCAANPKSCVNGVPITGGG
jgi:predicted lipoprotein with Yx(FWY)xxD motif